MSWFEDVTGTSNSERQAWRDSYNGGYAVGAGASFYNAHLPGGGGGSLGSSKSGSDGQVKGSGNAGPAPTDTTVKHVQPTNTGRGGGPTRVYDNGNWSPTQYAPNQAGGPVTGINRPPGFQAGTGAGTTGGGVRLNPVVEPDVTQVIIGGNRLLVDQGWSDGEAITQRTGEGDFLSPGWFYSWGVTYADTALNVNSWIDEQWSGGSSKPTNTSNLTSPDWDFGADMRWLNESSAGQVGGGF